MQTCLEDTTFPEGFSAVDAGFVRQCLGVQEHMRVLVDELGAHQQTIQAAATIWDARVRHSGLLNEAAAE